MRLGTLLVPLVMVVLFAACGNGESTTLPIPAPTPTALPVEVSESRASKPSIADIVRELRPSVVQVQTEAVQLDFFRRPVPVGGVGTGVILDVEGHILTNNHVIDGAQRIIITLSDGRVLQARLIGRDASLDLAVVKIDAENLVPIMMGSSAAVQVGDTVIAMGHALGLEGGPTVTGGLVSALDRFLEAGDNITIRHLIQTDAAINPGNSGGPLVNDRGEMVGINTAKIPGGEGIGFSIAVDPVKDLIDELIALGSIQRGFLGISPTNVTESLAMNLGLPVESGVGVISVTPGFPADQAGLRSGDIIVAVEGKPIDHLTDLDDALIEYRAGSTVQLEFFRDGRRLTVQVKLTQRP